MNAPLLELIPKRQLSREQKSFRPTKYEDGTKLPMFKFVREPVYLHEFDWTSRGDMTIWCDNGTIICVCRGLAFVQFEEPNVCFTIRVSKLKLECAIYGKTKASALETATFFWSLKRPKESNATLKLCTYSIPYRSSKEYSFDLVDLQTEQLARVLDANPEETFTLSNKDWSPEQTTSSFGSLCIMSDTDNMPFSRSNLERLRKLDVPLEKLKIGSVGEDCALIPFSANTKALEYKVYAVHLLSMDIGSLNIVARNLTLDIYLDRVENWYEFLIAFLNRVAALGHFERLRFSFYQDDGIIIFHMGEIARVAEALGRAISANSKLTHLDLSRSFFLVDSSSQLKIMSKAMETHEELRTVIVGKDPPYYDPDDSSDAEDDRSSYSLHPDYAWVEQLLSRNRNIKVLDRFRKKISNGTTIDKLYALNRFYNGSTGLVKASTPVRLSLVGTTLIESASDNFQYTALLLSNHTDVLCEFVQASIERVTSQPIEVEVQRSSLPRVAKKKRTSK